MCCVFNTCIRIQNHEKEGEMCSVFNTCIRIQNHEKAERRDLYAIPVLEYNETTIE